MRNDKNGFHKALSHYLILHFTHNDFPFQNSSNFGHILLQNTFYHSLVNLGNIKMVNNLPDSFHGWFDFTFWPVEIYSLVRSSQSKIADKSYNMQEPILHDSRSSMCPIFNDSFHFVYLEILLHIR